MPRGRHTKIVATLGPASSEPHQIEALFEAGADVFRLNFSHGIHNEHRRRLYDIRQIERVTDRPIGVLMDLQGPKLRLGQFTGHRTLIKTGDDFRLDLDPTPGDQRRAPLPHPEIFSALSVGAELLLDDGKVRLRVRRCGKKYAETEVVTGGPLSDHKGVNLPNALVNLSALTDKDKKDLLFGVDMGIDWIALSFVQRPEDVLEARRLVDGHTAILTKIEKPLAIERLDEIIELSDVLMVARGDLGVEAAVEDVPILQKRIVEACRRQGKPVIVATQMLESMIDAPAPTRAEASDVATAVYDGVDAVMLSAESAAGKYPLESVRMMDRIVRRVENDHIYQRVMRSEYAIPQETKSDAISAAARKVAETLCVNCIITYSRSGATARRVARERPGVPILGITVERQTARQLSLVWGVHCCQATEPRGFSDMTERACQVALKEEMAKVGDSVIVTAGVPFGQSGSTNILRIATIEDDTD